jgi:hypothetical protein
VTSLEAPGNEFAAVPAARLAQLSNLAHLDLSRNPLREWPLPTAPPHCLPRLASVLVASSRQLPPLPPDALASCASALTRLDLSGARPHASAPLAAPCCLRAVYTHTPRPRVTQPLRTRMSPAGCAVRLGHGLSASANDLQCRSAVAAQRGGMCARAPQADVAEGRCSSTVNMRSA